jgi:hypothetical protein
VPPERREPLRQFAAALIERGATGSSADGA